MDQTEIVQELKRQAILEEAEARVHLNKGRKLRQAIGALTGQQKATTNTGKSARLREFLQKHGPLTSREIKQRFPEPPGCLLTRTNGFARDEQKRWYVPVVAKDSQN